MAGKEAMDRTWNYLLEHVLPLFSGWDPILTFVIGFVFAVVLIKNDWHPLASATKLLKTLKHMPEKKRKVESEKAVITMKELCRIVEAIQRDRFDRRPTPVGRLSEHQIYHDELDQQGLAPSMDLTHQKYISHLERLIPFVERYGVKRARKEAASWYAGQTEKGK